MFDFVRAFQREREARTGRPCPVWVGEFGATRFTDRASQHRWFTDTLELMEEYGFGYAWFVYGAGATPRWEHFNQFGPEGEDLTLAEYFDAHKRGDTAYFEQFREQVRPSFQILADFMRRGAP
jgi:hypothetical protein